MPDPTEVATPVAAPVAEATPAPARSFRDVIVRRVGEKEAQHAVKIEAPAGAIPSVEVKAEAEPTEVVAEPAEKDPNVDRKFRALHKQKQKIRAREELVKQGEAKIRERDELATLLAKDKREFLRRLGISAKEVAELEKSAPQDPRTSAVERELQELREQLAVEKQEALTAQKKQLQEEIRRGIHDRINTQRDDLKYITAWDRQDEVYETALTFEQVHGRFPTESDIDQLARKVDSALKSKHEAANKRLGVTASPLAPVGAAPRSLSSLRTQPSQEARRDQTRGQKLHSTAEIFRQLSQQK